MLQESVHRKIKLELNHREACESEMAQSTLLKIG